MVRPDLANSRIPALVLALSNDILSSRNTLEKTKSSRTLEDRVAMLEAKTDNSGNKNLFTDEKLNDNSRNNQAHKKGK